MQGQICIDRLCYCLEGESVVECTAVAKALCTLDASTERRLRRKFDFLKENTPFTKMEVICQLEGSHGVDLGLKQADMCCVC